MRIEIRASGGPECETCGATERIYSPRHNAHLEADLAAHFAAETSRWRPIARHRNAKIVQEIERVCAELRARTITA